MSGVQQRLKLKQTPIDFWSLKEQLTLASAVLRTGDQNWVSVSRTMKQFWEPGRPPDWYSQKNCALQYNLIMEKADLPRRKRGEKQEGKDNPNETIVKTLGEERKEQLRLAVEDEKKEISRLEKQVQLLSSENVSEEEMEKIIKEIEEEEEEEERKAEEHLLFIQRREEKKLAIQAALKTGSYWKQAHVQNSFVSEQSGSELDSALDSPAPQSPAPLEDQGAGQKNKDVRPPQEEGAKISSPHAGEPAEPGQTQPPHQLEETVECSTVEVKLEKEDETKDEENKDAKRSISTDSRKNSTADIALKKEDSEVKTEIIEDEPETEANSKPKEMEVDIPASEVVDIKVEDISGEPEDKVDKEDVAEKKKNEERKKIDDSEDEKEEEVINDVEEVTAGDEHDDDHEENEKKEDETEVITNVKKETKDENKEVTKETKIEPVPEISPPKTIPKPETVPAKPEVILPTLEAPEIKITPRRGRPRSKKTSEVVEVKQEVKDEEEKSGSRQSSPGGQSAAPGAPGVPRPTSPSPEVKTRSGSRESEGSTTAGVGSTPTPTPGPSRSRRSSRPISSRGASPSLPSLEEEKEYKVWKKSILMVLSQIAQHKHASLFAAPVSEAEAPEYRDIVYQPVDLSSIKKSIESGVIRTTEGLRRELTLMFFNATMYNSSSHDVYRLSLAMYKDTEGIVQEYLNTQALLKASENPKLRMKEIIEGPVGRTRTGSGSHTPDDRKKPESKRQRTTDEYPAAKKRRLRNLDD